MSESDDDGYIAECVAAAPPLSAEQRARLKELSERLPRGFGIGVFRPTDPGADWKVGYRLQYIIPELKFIGPLLTGHPDDVAAELWRIALRAPAPDPVAVERMHFALDAGREIRQLTE